MFVYLSKVLPTLVYPTGFMFLCLIAALAFINSRPKLSRIIIILSLIIIWITGTPLLSNLMIRNLESTYPPYNGSETAKVIVVMGGGTDSWEYPRQMVELSGAGDRILYASKLLKEGKGDLLLFGGSYYTVLDGAEQSVAAEMAAIAEEIGVSEDKILLQEGSLNSYEEAVADSQILKKMGEEQIILVTSATHMRRAVACFEKQGIKVIPAPVDYAITDKEWAALTEFNLKRFHTWIIPQSGNIRAFETALKEYLGIFMYRLRGWI
ncbi:MAG: YdcF family protein [Chloroflexi bacterium]|nr:YdcF family protein [Chloroflexota bacterium]